MMKVMDLVGIASILTLGLISVPSPVSAEETGKALPEGQAVTI